MSVLLVDAVLLTALLTVAGVLVLSLVRGALRHWHAERAGTAYELPVCYRGAALRAAGAVVVTAMTAVAAVVVLSGPEHRTFTSTATGPPGPAPSAAANPEPGAPTTSPATPPPLPAPSPRPSSSRSTSDSRAPSPTVSARVLGHPSGGALHRLEGLGPGSAEVWLPSGYARRDAADLAFPVVVAHVPGGAEAADLFAAFAAQQAGGRAHPFIVVVSPDCGRDLRPLLKAVDSRYRTLPDSASRAVLGLGPTSSCALDTALRRPGDFRAAVALGTRSGDHTGHARPSTVRIPASAPGGSGKPQLLLASTATDLPARADAVRLRAALAPFAETRIVDTVEASGERRNLFGVAARYLTEQLGGPTRT